MISTASTLSSLKVIVLGDNKAGKTSLCLAFERFSNTASAGSPTQTPPRNPPSSSRCDDASESSARDFFNASVTIQLDQLGPLSPTLEVRSSLPVGGATGERTARVQMELWDIAGERTSLNKIFYRNARCAIVVVDASDVLVAADWGMLRASLSAWKSAVDEFASEGWDDAGAGTAKAPCLLVVNKMDLIAGAPNDFPDDVSTLR